MTTQSMTTDRLERSILIDAPRARVWRALTNAEEFGRWFGVNLAGQRFAAGQRVQGNFTIEGFTHAIFDVIVEDMEPEKLFSWRWHPHAVERGVDYSKEERTRVSFTLKEAAGGATLLTVEETGFDKVPPERRMDALRMVTRGWEAQLKNIQAYAAAH